MIRVEPDLPTPAYEQVRDQIQCQVAAGELQPGDKLPTVRQLATDLGLAVNTVAKAYRELEHRGVITTRGRAGTFVSDDDAGHAARAAAASYVERVTALGIGADEALELVRRGLARRTD